LDEFDPKDLQDIMSYFTDLTKNIKQMRMAYTTVRNEIKYFNRPRAEIIIILETSKEVREIYDRIALMGNGNASLYYGIRGKYLNPNTWK